MTACTMCRTRLSYDDGTHAHPHCRGDAPITDAEMTRLVHALGGLLGGTQSPRRPVHESAEPRAQRDRSRGPAAR